MGASPRLVWAADVVDPAPSERVLGVGCEVGCGHGVLVSLIVDRVESGVVVGVARSATMIAAAGRRNRAAVEAGRVGLEAASLVDADLAGQAFDVAGQAFDVAVPFDVRAFRTPPAPEWDVLDRVPAPAAGSSSRAR